MPRLRRDETLHSVDNGGVGLALARRVGGPYQTVVPRRPGRRGRGRLVGGIYGLDAILARWTGPLHGTITTHSGPIRWDTHDLRIGLRKA